MLSVATEVCSIMSQWNKSTVVVFFRGEPREFTFSWREPMDFIVDLISDPSLMEHSNFHAVIKELFINGKPTRMYDEPWTGQTWWDIEVPCIVFLLYSS
jgi:hypothetical protein